jgi:hypothetical protein
MVPGIHEKKRMRRVADAPGDEVSSVLVTTIRSTPAVRHCKTITDGI